MEEKKTKPVIKNRWLGLTVYGSQMGLGIFVFAKLGKYLDHQLGFQKPWLAVGLSLLAMLTFIISLLRYLKKLEEYEKAEKDSNKQ